jgi:hypothetical protein
MLGSASPGDRVGGNDFADEPMQPARGGRVFRRGVAAQGREVWHRFDQLPEPIRDSIRYRLAKPFDGLHRQGLPS